MKNLNTNRLFGGREMFKVYQTIPSNAEKIKDEELFLDVLRVYNKAMFHLLLTTGKRIKLPFMLGHLVFVRHKTNIVLDEDGNLDEEKSLLLTNMSKTMELRGRDQKAMAEKKKVYYMRDYFAVLKWLKPKAPNKALYYFTYNKHCIFTIKEMIEGNTDLLDLYEDARGRVDREPNKDEEFNYKYDKTVFENKSTVRDTKGERSTSYVSRNTILNNNKK